MEKETNEILKTALLGIVAFIALICWLKFQPRLPDVKPKERIGLKLLESFNDVSQMRQIEFSRIDPKTGELEEMVLVRSKDSQQWTIPSMSNFPAENAEEVAKVVAPLMQLSVLDVVDEAHSITESSKTDELHRECGLLNPVNYVSFDLESDKEDKDLAAGSALSVKIMGENGEELVNLLIGSRIPESSATRDDRYVRFPNDDVVYVVDFSGDSTQELGTTEFTEFPDRVSFDPLDWVDRDLLRISRWDVAYLTSRDQSFSLVKTEAGFEQTKIQRNGIAIFKQSTEESLSRVWSLSRFIKYQNTWSEIDAQTKSAQNDVLNSTIDLLGSLKISDVRKKPDSLCSCFTRKEFGAELVLQKDSLGEFGFSFFDSDPLDQQKIEPLLVGEGGNVELTLKSGIKIVLIFGKKFDDQRACIAYSVFDSKFLEESVEDEAEAIFLSQDAQKKAELKNQRFANWFYLISEEDFQALRLRISDTIR